MLTEHPQCSFPRPELSIPGAGLAQSPELVSFPNDLSVGLGSFPCKPGWAQSCRVPPLPPSLASSLSPAGSPGALASPRAGAYLPPYSQYPPLLSGVDVFLEMALKLFFPG